MRKHGSMSTGGRRVARIREAAALGAPAKRAGAAASTAPARGRTYAHRLRLRRTGGVLAAAAVFALVGTLALVPLHASAPSSSALPEASADDATRDAVQRVTITDAAKQPTVSRESYTASTGPETLVLGGTNHDWAKLVLVEGGFPVTDANVAVITQWMREENGPDNWWNRNNPLNNGNGSGGGSGLGSYATLQVGAFYAADSLRRLAFYDAIEAGLDAGSDAAGTAAAIWASPWATSHYGNGSHWTTSPVPVVEAPASAWGR
jgi:hypothetical protein